MNSWRTVVLRNERFSEDRRYLEAHLDADGNLHIDGQDLGPGTAIVSDDGEYEWLITIAAADVPQVIGLLDGNPGDEILDLLERNSTGNRSYELERRLRESRVPITRMTF